MFVLYCTTSGLYCIILYYIVLVCAQLNGAVLCVKLSFSVGNHEFVSELSAALVDWSVYSSFICVSISFKPALTLTLMLIYFIIMNV